MGDRQAKTARPTAVAAKGAARPPTPSPSCCPAPGRARACRSERQHRGTHRSGRGASWLCRTSGTRRTAATTSPMPIGTLMKNAHCHDSSRARRRPRGRRPRRAPRSSPRAARRRRASPAAAPRAAGRARPASSPRRRPPARRGKPTSSQRSVRQPARQAGGGEDDQPGDEAALAAVAVGEPAHRDEQRGEDHRVGVEDPAQRGLGPPARRSRGRSRRRRR